MKWFWVVGCDNAVADPLVVNAASPTIDRSVLINGNKVEEWDPESWLRATSLEYDGQPDDALQNHLSLPVFSKRLRDLLDRAGVRGFQYLPVRVLRPDSSLVGTFHIGNVLRIVPALDRDRSDFTIYPSDYFLESRRGAVSGIRKAVLLASQLNDADVIRLAEFPEAMYVSEKMRDAFESTGMTGYSFHEVALTKVPLARLVH